MKSKAKGDVFALRSTKSEAGRKFRGYAPERAASGEAGIWKKGKVGVLKGHGPRHAENALEGMPSTDVVPAMLTPREAVLNRNAAEMAGRGTIEKLNKKGNQLAAQGVDLAAGGDADVEGKYEVPGYPLAWYLRRLWEEMRGRKSHLDPDDKAPAGDPYVSEYRKERAIRRGNPAPNEEMYPEGQQKGTSDMKEKAQKMQGGGWVPQGKPEVETLPAKNPYNSIGGFGPPQAGGGSDPVSMPGMRMLGPMRAHGRDFSSDWQSGHPQFGANWQRDPRGGYMQRQSQYTPMPYPGVGSDPRYLGPPGQIHALQGGAAEVPGIGAPNPQTAYGPPIQLSAPQLQQAAQKAGLSSQQIQGLMSAVQGFGGAYNSIGGGLGGGGTGGMDAAGGFQGGISDIGYPPFVAPGAEYHADKGGWLGPYDPAYTFNSYARGIASVPALRSPQGEVVPFR